MRTYDPKQPSVFLQYLDVVGLYSKALTYRLPVGGFRDLTEEELRVMEKDPSLIQKCIVEVDLDVPNTQEFHNWTRDYPLAAEQKEILGVRKLVPNLLDKRSMVFNYVELNSCLKYGLVLKKIHRGFAFEETSVVGDYIKTNGKFREEATSKFGKDFKLMNNSCFGKFLENLRKRCNIELVDESTEKGAKKLKKLISLPTYEDVKSFDGSSLLAVFSKKGKITLDRPIAIGVAVLGISKAIMNGFHFGFMKPLYGNKCRVCMSDTDSLFYRIETDDWYEDMKPYWKTHFDTWEYPEDHFASVPRLNKKVMGLMSDECKGKIVEEFVALRPKMYSYKLCNGKEGKRAKGVKKSIVSKNIRFNDFVRCLKEKRPMMTSFRTFRQREHEIFTEKVTKIALSHQDTKRYVLGDGTYSSLPWGHRDIPKEERLL